MPVVAVINRKGGSGKSTLATHLAGWCASSGWPVMLGDVDRQQSSMAWLRRRGHHPQAAEIVGWALDGKHVLRPPAGISHVVLDTPGGLRGPDLARLVMNVDTIVMPVCPSAFDRDSAAECHAELMTLPRVASGRCKVAVVGMRVDARTKAAEQLQAWAQIEGLRYLGAIRETQAYVRSVEQGLTLFDLPPAKADIDLAQWRPIIEWLQEAWAPAPAAPAGRALARMPAKPASGDDAPHVSHLPHAPARPGHRLAAPVPLHTLQSGRRGLAGRLGWLLGVFRST